MIKRINTIKKLGVFQDYRRDGNLNDFNDKNILYGWNYSGKTTISRLISFLDKNAVLDPDYANIEFDIELADGTHINHLNRHSSPILVKVFNSDFVRNNLHFDSDEKIQGIKFAVGDVATVMGQIQVINDHIAKTKEIIARNNHSIIEFNNLRDLQFTDNARSIAEILALGRSFTKRNIIQFIEYLENTPLENFVIVNPSELELIRTNSTSQPNGATIVINTPETKYTSILAQVEAILQKQPSFSSDDELLSANKDLYDWSKKGLEIYKNHPDLHTCAFCGSPISKEGRLSDLNRYYSNEAAKVKDEIENIKPP